MAKIPVNPVLLLISKRSYAVAADNARLLPGGTVVSKAPVGESASGNASAKKEEIYWMKDPKSGNWVPENQFGQIDAAELREKFLSKKHNI